MKLCLNQQRNRQGSVLLVALGITFVLGLGLASYLSLARWQHVSVVRSQAWNAALALAEAGVEEALAQLNPSALIFGTNINRGANGWTLLADGMYHAPRRTLPHGSYDVAMTADALPTIYATGYVTIPTLSATISRSVRVATGTSSLFRGSLAARVNVDLKGNSVMTDSFDSMDPNHSTDGLYDVAKRKANGDVACTEGFINVQNANVMGTLYTGPYGGCSVGSQGTVGDLGWVLGGNLGLQPGHYKNDFNLDFPDVLPPFQTAVPPDGDTIDGTNYTWILGYGNYMHTEPKGAKFNTGDIILVVGRARVYVTGEFIMGGGSKIIITPGASLELYVGGADAAITSVNNAGNCATFSYFGLPSNRRISLSGNDVFLGTIYAPTADLTMGGGGNNTLDYQGAIAINTIQMNGHFNFHFDENLRRKGPARGYQITSWTEI
jgi:hypothetical protein